MTKNTKVTKAVAKAAKQVPIIAWAVEVNGEIKPHNIFSTRETAREVRNDVDEWAWASGGVDRQKAHIRKIAIQVIDGR